MNSFHMIYDAEGDIFEVDFRLAGERPERGYELNDNVVIWSDAGIGKIHRILFISYSKLLERSAVTLTRLKKFPASQRERIQRALDQSPIKQFLVCLDREKCHYVLTEPDLKGMVKAA